jgi:hypothetical protein
MTIEIKHKFTSAKADGVDSTLIQPSNWNDTHDITMAAGKVLGRDTSGAGAVQELSLAVDPTGQSLVPPSGPTVNRPSTTVTGMFRYNTSLNKYEGYNGTAWTSIAFEGTANNVSFGSIDFGNSDTTLARGAKNTLTVEGKGLPIVLAQSNVAQPCISTTTTTFATITVPGGAMGPNGYIEIQTWHTLDAVAGARFFEITAAGTQITYLDSPASTYFRRVTTIGNRNNQAAQVVYEPKFLISSLSDYSSAVPGTHTNYNFDTSVDWNLVLRGRVFDLSDQFNLLGYRVLLFYGA